MHVDGDIDKTIGQYGQNNDSRMQSNIPRKLCGSINKRRSYANKNHAKTNASVKQQVYFVYDNLDGQ